MPALIHLVAKFSLVEIAVIGLLFWLLLAYLHVHVNRRR